MAGQRRGRGRARPSGTPTPGTPAPGAIRHATDAGPGPRGCLRGPQYQHVQHQLRIVLVAYPEHYMINTDIRCVCEKILQAQ